MFYWLGALLLIGFSGFREIGIDHDSVGYKNYYESGDLIWLMAEPTFGIISEFVRYAFNDFRFVLIIYAILGVWLKFIAIERLTELKWLTIITYFSTFYLLHDFTQIRASIASGILLIALVPLSQRRIWVYMGLICVAILFHYSAIVALPLCFFNNNHLSGTQKTLIALAIPIGIVLHLIHFDPLLVIPIDTIKVKIEIYRQAQASAEVSLNVFNLVYLVKYMILYVLLYFYETIYKQNKYVSLLLQIYALSLFCYLALSSNTIFAMRISELYGIVEMILIPFLYYVVRPRAFAIGLVVFVALIYMIINIYSLELIYAVSEL